MRLTLLGKGGLNALPPLRPTATPSKHARLVLATLSRPSPHPCSALHLADSITPHNISHDEWGLLGLCKDVANKKNKGNPGRGGGGAASRLSLSFNSSPHLKIFCAKAVPPPACYAACTRPSSLCLAGYAHTSLTPTHRLATHASGLLVERTWAYCPCA